jgi:dynein heavy chain
LACQQFISATLGDEYGTPITDQIADLYEETKPDRPVLYLLSKGADPTSTIDEFAKKKKQFPTGKVSMGEEMEIPAMQLIT